VDDVIGFVNENVLPHWPFFSWVSVAMLVGQVVKKTVWTEWNSRHAKPLWFWWWGRKTMVLHPVITGVLIGAAWRNPEGADPAWGLPASMAYFAMAGALSTWAYELLHGFAKKRGVDLDIDGLSEPPPAPPPAPPSEPEPDPELEPESESE
jgi:hypothetical protein